MRGGADRASRGTRHVTAAPAAGPFSTAPCRASVEALTLRVAELVSERQQLRDRGASETALERNRIQLARAQWELGHALIERHLPAAQPAA